MREFHQWMLSKTNKQFQENYPFHRFYFNSLAPARLAPSGLPSAVAALKGMQLPSAVDPAAATPHVFCEFFLSSFLELG